MMLLFDHHLSYVQAHRLSLVFPGSTQTHLSELSKANDADVWNHAKKNGFIVVSLESNFYDLSVLWGHPPKLIWLQCENSGVDRIDQLLRANRKRIEVFAADPAAPVLAYWRTKRGKGFTHYWSTSTWPRFRHE